MLNFAINSFPSQFGHSTSNLLDLLHGGRPKDEEPHVKRSLAKKDNDGIEYICRVNLVRKIVTILIFYVGIVLRKSWAFLMRSLMSYKLCLRWIF